jgi:hypothetical protein
MQVTKAHRITCLISRVRCPIRRDDRRRRVSGQDATPSPSASAASLRRRRDDAPLPATKSPYDALPPEMQQLMERPFTRGHPELVKRRLTRVGVTFNRTHYFIDGARTRHHLRS